MPPSAAAMTPRERWLAILAGRPLDRIPTDYQATPEVTARLKTDLVCATDEDLWRRLRIDARLMVEPAWTLPHHPDDPWADLWGVRYRKVVYGTGTYDEPAYHPLARIEDPHDLGKHRWPQTRDFDYEAVTKAVEASDGSRPIHSGCYEPFLIYGRLRGLERAFEDLALRPLLVEAALDRIFEFHYEHHRRIFEAGKGRIDLTWVAEDLGSQTGPLMGLPMYRRFLLPNQVRMADLARSHGIHVLYHTDGAARLFLPDLVDKVGIEVLNPIQWRCPGMDREGLARDFGRRIVFHGAIDNQRTMPFGGPEDVAREVQETAEIFRECRWICAPCHNLQPITPTANVLILYATADSVGARARRPRGRPARKTPAEGPEAPAPEQGEGSP